MIYNIISNNFKKYLCKYLINLIKNNKITDFKALSRSKYINEFIIDYYQDNLWDWEWLNENTDINIEKYIPFNLIEKYSYKWNYNLLSINSNLTIEFILKYPYKNWSIRCLIKNNKITDFKALSKFKYINYYIIDDYPNKPWDWVWLIENTDIYVEKYISLNLIEKYPYKWNYWDLSYNPNLTEKFILKYPYKNWNIEYLIDNNKITDFKVLSKFKYINQYIINKYPNKLWDQKWINENFNYTYTLNLTEEFILKHPNKNWNIKYLIKNKITDFKSLSKFKNINNNIINKYPNKPWDWDWLIQNTNISVEKYIPLDLIEKYPYKWNYHILSENPNITKEFILKYLNKCWDISMLIKNNKINDFKILCKFNNLSKYNIKKYPDKPWDWEWMILNTDIYIEKYIPLELIKKYPHRLCYWYLSKNPNLTKEFIMKYSFKNWNIIELIKNNKITDFNALTKFKNINQYIIDKYPDKLWDWDWLIQNTDINIEEYIPLNIIEKYPYKWNYKKLKNITKKFFYKY